MNRPIRVGTRQSDLAVAQCRIVISRIKAVYPEFDFELVKMKTRGDILLDTRLDLAGGKGLFVNEIETALLEGSVDMAVHSMKDMPASMPEGLVIAAVSEREDPRDVLICREGNKPGGLCAGAVVGTSSIRREVQLLNMRPDIKVKPLRGNVPSRIDKLETGAYDAIILAAAGMIRLGLAGRVDQYFTLDEMIPAIGQGILGVQTKKGGVFHEMLQRINCHDSSLQLEAERAFMLRLNGGCSTPIAAHASLQDGKMRLLGMLASQDRHECFKAFVEGEKMNAMDLGIWLAEEIRSKASAKASGDEG